LGFAVGHTGFGRSGKGQTTRKPTRQQGNQARISHNNPKHEEPQNAGQLDLGKAKHKIVGDSTLLDRVCYKIELIPKPDAPVVWGKVILFIDKTDFIQLRSEMYDEDGYLVNVMSSSQIKEMDGIKLATKIQVIPQEDPGNKTVMEITSIQFNKPIADRFFTTQNMKKIR
jgi:outer membrane lipoprotein-sorting protein